MSTVEDASKYFPTSEVAVSAPKKARRGRPPKARHDIPTDVPIDGDYKLLTLKNQDPKFSYKWFTDSDRATASYRRFVPVTWEDGCAQPALFFGEMTKGTEVKFKELTLHKALTSEVNKIEAAERFTHNKIIQGLLQRAVDSGGTAKVHTQEVAV